MSSWHMYNDVALALCVLSQKFVDANPEKSLYLCQMDSLN